MRSHLTHAVFRRLLLNQPVVKHRSVYTQAIRPRPRLPSHGTKQIIRAPRRTLFGLFEGKPQRDLREPTLDPGMSKMLELDKRIHLIARYPPTEELKGAFNAFLQTKRERKLPLEDFHATQLLQTLKVIEDESKKQQQPYLDVQDYYRAIFVISQTPAEKFSPVHNELAWLSYEKWVQATSRVRELLSAEEQQKSLSSRMDCLSRMVSILCRTGQTVQAREMLARLSDPTPGHDIGVAGHTRRLEPRLVDGFSREDNELEMLHCYDKLKSDGREKGKNLNASLLLFYARKNNVSRTKYFATEDVLTSVVQSQSLDWYTPAEVRKELFAFCLRNNEMEWAQSVLQGRDGALDEEAVLLGAVAVGKSIEELDRILAVLAQHSGKSRWTPSINTINSLLDYAVSNGDPYTAERFFALGQKWRAPVNAQTYIQQVRYRLLARDINGALTAYASLREQPVSNNEDWDVMNELTQALATSPNTDHNTLMGLAADLTDRHLLFPAQTVAKLAQYHLQRDEYFELVDLLQTYAYQYSTTDRIMLRDLLFTVCLDPQSDTARVWDTYMIFHQVFDLETNRTPRADVMKALYDRGRPDLGTHVFTRTARHSRSNTRPDHDMYVDALLGIAKTSESEALEVVHNMLKLDTEVEPSTKMRNALMRAYTACGSHWRALEFWEDISASAEGPSYASLDAAFGACERTSWGYETAKRIWDRLMKSEVEITVGLCSSYVAALAGNGLLQDAYKVVDEIGEITGKSELRDKEQVIGSLFNALRGVVQQEETEDWALEKYSEVWESLKQGGLEENEMGIRRIKSMKKELSV